METTPAATNDIYCTQCYTTKDNVVVFDPFAILFDENTLEPEFLKNALNRYGNLKHHYRAYPK